MGQCDLKGCLVLKGGLMQHNKMKLMQLRWSRKDGLNIAGW